MSSRHPIRTLALLASTLLLGFAAPAFAQAELPPGHKDLKNGRPWTYQLGKMVLAGALLVLVLCVVGYLLKAREFNANERRGGSK